MTGGLTPEQAAIVDSITAANTTPVNPYGDNAPIGYTTPFDPGGYTTPFNLGGYGSSAISSNAGAGGFNPAATIPNNTGIFSGTNVNASGYRPVATAGFNPGGYGASANAGPFGSQPFTPGATYNPYG